MMNKSDLQDYAIFGGFYILCAGTVIGFIAYMIWNFGK